MVKNSTELQKLRLLNNIGRAISSTREPKAILRFLLKKAVRIMKASGGSILLIEPKTRLLRVEVARNISRAKIGSLGLKVGQGVTGWVARTGRPLLVQDVDREPKYVRVEKRIRSELAVPLILKGKVIGVINVDSTRRGAFTKTDLELLSSLATHSVQIIQNARLYSESRKEARKLASLFRIGQTMISNIDFEEVLSKIASEAAKLTGTRLCSLMLLDGKKGELTIRSVYGGSERYVRKPNLPVKESLLGQVVLKRQPLQVLDVQRCAAYRHRDIAREEGLASLLSVPMVFQEKVIGILNVYSGSIRHFTKEEVDVLSALASLSAMAIENTRLYGNLFNAEEYLRRQERLAVLGEVAAEIAHEIRNPLTVIKMLFESVQGRVEGELGGLVRKDVQVIGDRIRQMERIVDQVLSMGRPGELFLIPSDIKDCLDESLAFMRFRLAQHHVALETHYEKQIPQLPLDKGLMSQVFLNIILNAIEAMSNGGTLKVYLRTESDKVLVQFQDTGVGIAPEYLERLFQPFFTSKSKGSGLGLAIVRRIVEGHSGRVRVASEVGRGTCFTLELPLSK